MKASQPAPVRWTRDQYYAMGEAGIFSDRPRVELVDGEILQVSPQNRRHRNAIAFSTTVLVQLFAATHVVQVQLPLDLGDYSQPEPDFALVPILQAQTATLHPTCPDLVIEISASTLRFDRNKKARLYAAHAIPEYWIVNLSKNILEVYRQPGAGLYTSVTLHDPQSPISPLFQPKAVIPLQTFFAK